MPYVVTRQLQYPDGNHVVEISSGGIDYTNPDALAAKYTGEFEEFADPREAVDVGWQIAAAWQRNLRANGDDNEVMIAMGCTGGDTMPFDGEPLLFANFLQMRKSARIKWEKLPKCDQCGELLGKERFGSWEHNEFNCCSEYCAERYYHLDFDEELVMAEEDE